MSDAIRPRAKVTAHVPFTSPHLSSPNTFHPRVRAKVDPTTIATPPSQPRTSLRSTPSSSSIHSSTSHASSSRALSTVPPNVIETPPIKPVSYVSQSRDVTPVMHVRAKSMVRAKSPETPGLYRRLTGPASEVGPGPGPGTGSGSMQPPSRGANLITDRGRMKVRTLPTTPSPILPRPSTLLSPGIFPSPVLANNHSSKRPPLRCSPDHLSTSNPSSSRQSDDSLLLDVSTSHSTPACPPSSTLPPSDYFPLPHANLRARIPPCDPLFGKSSPSPPVPVSPVIRNVALPAMTSRRLSDDIISDSRTIVKRSERNRMSDSTAVELDLSDNSGVLDKEKDMDFDVVIEAGAEEAKVNRKIADLEISNASLLAINRSLEATKAKQRSEISKLRRALRDSFSGMPLPSTTFASLPLNSPLTPFSPSLDVDESEYFDDEIVDSELEVKWERISDLVGVMRRRGEEAVVKGREEIKLGQRVLGWSEVQLEAGREGENEKDCRRKGEEDFGRGADFTEREDFEGKDDSAREEDLSEVREEDTDDCVEPS